MFSVIFEVHPKTDRWDDYLGYAKLLRPELVQVDGFVDNIRYRSLNREGWILSLSGWRDEKSVVRWRTKAVHHDIQEKGRFEVFLGYHLRVGEITSDTHVPEGYKLTEQRLDETEVGDGTTAVLIDATQVGDWVKDASAQKVSEFLGLDECAKGLIASDVFDAVLTPGDVLLLLSFEDKTTAAEFIKSARVPDGARIRSVRVVRDYGMFDRREAPQYYPDAKGEETLHA